MRGWGREARDVDRSVAPNIQCTTVLCAPTLSPRHAGEGNRSATSVLLFVPAAAERLEQCDEVDGSRQRALLQLLLGLLDHALSIEHVDERGEAALPALARQVAAAACVRQLLVECGGVLL